MFAALAAPSVDHSITWELERNQIRRRPPRHRLIQKEHFNKIPAGLCAQESLRSSHLRQEQTTYRLRDTTLKPGKAIKKKCLLINLCIFPLCHHYPRPGLCLGLHLEEESKHSLLLLPKSSPRFMLDIASPWQPQGTASSLFPLKPDTHPRSCSRVSPPRPYNSHFHRDSGKKTPE